MSLVMIETSRLPPFVSAFYETHGQAGIAAVAVLSQQRVQQSTNHRNGQRRRILFSPGVFTQSKTMLQ